MSFSATHAAFSGFRFIGKRPSVILIWALFYAVAVGLVAGGAILIFGATALADLASGGDRDYQSLEEVMPFLQALGALVAFLTVSLTLVAGVQLAAAYRAVLRPDDVGFGYLKLGGDELRQIVLMLVFSVLHLVLWGVPIGLAIAAHVLADLEAPAAVALYILAGFVALFLSIWIGVRLSLAPPMTLADRRLHLGRSWTMTRGRFLPLLGMYTLTVLFGVMLWVVTEVLADLVAAAAGFSAVNLHDPAAFDISALGGMVIGGGVAYALIYVISQAFVLAVFYVPQATAYAEIMAERQAGADVVT